MDVSALERSIKTLETSLDSLEVWLAMMTSLVVLGLVLEYWHEIPEAISDFKRAANWVWKPVLVITGAILITVGVAGELAVQFLASRVGTDLRTTTHAVEALLNKQAEDARTKAEEATATSKGFESKIADANARAKKAEAVVASANAESHKAAATVATAEARIAEAQRDAAQARKEAEMEHLARVRIEEALAGWKLSPEGRERLSQKLKRFAGAPFDLFVTPSEAPFVDLLDGALADAGWTRKKPKDANGQEVSILFENKAAILFISGITVEVAQDSWEALQPAATALIQALIDEEIPAKGSVVAKGSALGAIHIAIGRRM